MTKSPTPAPKAMQADGVLDDAAPNTKTPDPSGTAATPDQQGADNPGPTPEELQAKADADAAAAEAQAQADLQAAEAVAAQAQADVEAAEALAAQVTADAEAAEAAAAQALADADAAAALAEPAPALDLAALRYCEKQITLLNVTGHRLMLLDELRDLYGAVITTDDDLGRVTVTLQGITIDPADSVHTALDNWGNAARRAIAEAAA